MGEGAPPSGNIRTEEVPRSHRVSWVKHVGRALVMTPAGPLLLSSFVCLAIAYKKLKKPHPSPPPSTHPPSTHPPYHRSMYMAALYVDKAAADNVVNQMKDLLAEKEHIQFDKLKRAAAKLEMSGKEDEAVEMLHKAWEEADKERHRHEAHELQMLLVEMLIYKGEYVKALGCKCLEDKDILDARGPLYKAVIYSILKKPEKAKEHYEEFQKNKRHSMDLLYSFKEGSLAYEAVCDFAEFNEIVNDIKKEIERAHQPK